MLKRLIRAFISNECRYSYENFLKGDFIYVPGYYQKKVEPKKNKIYLSESDLLVWEEFDKWPSIRNTYKCKVTLEFNDDTTVEIPSPILFGPRTDDDLILCLATLDSENPDVVLEFYKSGDKYGKGDSNIVKRDNKLVKSIYIFTGNNGKHETVIDSVERYIHQKSQEENNEVVRHYLLRIKQMRTQIETDKFYNNPKNFLKESSESFYDNPYHNDRLDLDQQNPEFWDNL